MSESRDWKELFQPSTQIRIEKGGRITASPFFETPQIIEIVEVSEMRDKDGNWPQALTLKGIPFDEESATEVAVDNLYVRHGIEREEARILD